MLLELHPNLLPDGGQGLADRGVDRQHPLDRNIVLAPALTAVLNQPSTVAVYPVTVTHDQHPEAIAEPEQDEAILFLRMLRIFNQEGSVIPEHRLRFFERLSSTS